jgi:hypothetical protein
MCRLVNRNGQNLNNSGTADERAPHLNKTDRRELQRVIQRSEEINGSNSIEADVTQAYGLELDLGLNLEILSQLLSPINRHCK